MVPLLGMLEILGLSLSDAEAGGYPDLARAAARCRACKETDPCTRWLKWRGRCGEPPACANARYLAELKSLRCIKSAGTKPT